MLLRWAAELDRLAIAAALRGEAPKAWEGYFPRKGLQVWASLAPRQLLDAVPGLLPQLLDAIASLAASPSAAYYLCLHTEALALLRLADVDPPRLRALPQVPRVVAAAATYASRTASLPADVRRNGLVDVLVPLLALYAPGRGAAMAACGELLTHMVGWAVGPPPGPDGDGVPKVEQQLGIVAASLLVPVARDAFHAAGGGLPLPLRSPAARAGWGRLAAAAHHPALGAAATELDAMATAAAAGGRAPAGSPAAVAPEAASLVERLRRCWTCGCPYRSPGDGRELRKCAGCKVAAYCGAACAAAGWAADHRASCAGWRAYAAAAAAARGGAAADYVIRAGSHRTSALTPFSADLAGDWRTKWPWAPTVAAEVVAAGLPLSDVVILAELASGAHFLACLVLASHHCLVCFSLSQLLA